jgi:glycosyltransferase involved in cell wall biosynthesis
MDLSIIIPAFNEALKIGDDVTAAAVFFEEHKISGEVIVVDDGSVDRTYDAVRSVKVPPSVKLTVTRLETNMGKGSAVKTGVLKSSGDIVLYADSGTCIPYRDALPSIERVRRGSPDVAMASRRLKGTVICRDRPLKRRVLAWLFHQTALLIVRLPRRITDSQCGFKVTRGDLARELYSGLETSGFLFELEIILKAFKRGYVVEEFPVTWTCDLDTRLRPGSQAVPVLKELFAVRKILKRM